MLGVDLTLEKSRVRKVSRCHSSETGFIGVRGEPKTIISSLST